jgi:transposase-like protein
MAKVKYDKDTFPVRAEKWAREGANDRQIAAKLGISESTFYQYVRTYAEFKQALKKGKAPVDTLVENSLLKRALGYEYTETKKVTRGEKVVREESTTKQVVPDTTAQIFWLKNRKPAIWRDKQVLGHELEKLSDEDLNKVITGLFADSEGHKKNDNEKAD